MSYVGGKLEPWFDDGPNHRFCRDVADKAGSRMTALTKADTPIEHGHLRRSIKQKPVRVGLSSGGHRTYSSGCETDVEYGPHVEHGTGLWGLRRARYEIKPKRPGGWLRWIDRHTGQPVFARRVLHPGSPGAHMFAKGAALAEAEFDTFAQPRLLVWAREVEEQNRTSL